MPWRASRENCWTSAPRSWSRICATCRAPSSHCHKDKRTMSDNPPIEFAFPELRKWEKGAAPYVHALESGNRGPTVMVTALTHGNEVSGAVVVDALLEKGLKPRQGTLIFAFNNIEAYHSFDPRTPFKSRMID